MVNILGEAWLHAGGEPDWSLVLGHPRAKLHLYGKREARAGRKMGHYTVLAESLNESLNESLDDALALALDIRARLKPLAQPAQSIPPALKA
jgi:5-(carboxyamino)imidazole ribonucleotide synthase